MKKIIVAGCGDRSNSWITVALKREGYQITALVDPMIERAKGRKEEHKLNANVYAKLTDALDKEDADIVFDVTPPEYHFQTVTTALKAGCHVFGEKPMADTIENAEKMIQCSDDTKKEYFVMQNYRYKSEIIALRDFIKSGELGDIGMLSVNYQLNPRLDGFRAEMDNPLILDMAIHTFDKMRFISGFNTKSVYCREFNPSWSWFKGDAAAVCIFEMENGTIFDYRGSWVATGLITAWHSQWNIACADGTIYWDGNEELFWDGKKKEFWGRDPEERIKIDVKPIDNSSYVACMIEMFDAIEKGVRPQTDCRDNINSIKMVLKAIESSKTKKLVYI